MLTGETAAYYGDYADAPAERLARSLQSGYVYQGEASPFRGGKPRGTPSDGLPPTSFVNFLQNHDQIGNRAFGERLTTLTMPKKLRAAVALLLLSPQIPLVFMGEEIGSRAPFHYFVDHNPDLVEAIREGRQKEFQDLVPSGDDLPEPNAKETFEISRPESDAPDAEEWAAFYRQLLALRSAEIAPRLDGTVAIAAEAISDHAVMASWRLGDGATLTVATNFAEIPVASAFPSLPPVWGNLVDGDLPPSTTVAWLVT
jgi:maltooligosyltrehalose trehalohydrolase